jgi:hypothetical protein
MKELRWDTAMLGFLQLVNIGLGGWCILSNAFAKSATGVLGCGAATLLGMGAESAAGEMIGEYAEASFETLHLLVDKLLEDSEEHR